MNTLPNCKLQVLFIESLPKDSVLSVIQKQYDKITWSYVAKKLLNKVQYESYLKIENLAGVEYEKVVAPAWLNFRTIEGKAWLSYKENPTPKTHKRYKNILHLAKKKLKEIKDPAFQHYLKTVSNAFLDEYLTDFSVSL